MIHRSRLVDVRGPAEFSGEHLAPRAAATSRAAVLWPWEENLRPDGALRDPPEIRSVDKDEALCAEQELVTYCQGGVCAAHAALALGLAGYPRVRIYDGSWAEWGNDPAAPIDGGLTAAAP